MKHRTRNKRMIALALSASMTAAAVMNLPAGLVTAQSSADLYYQNQGIQNLTYSGSFATSPFYSSLSSDTFLPNNQRVSCSIGYGNGRSYYIDQERNIRLVGSQNTVLGRYPLKQRVFEPSYKWPERNRYIALMHNVAYAYDYFRSIGYEGYSYTGYAYDPQADWIEDSVSTDSTIYVAVVDENCPGETRFGMSLFSPTNATSEHGLIATGIGDAGSGRRFPLADPDVAVHEMAHLITEQYLGWDSGTYSGETGALMEAYSDIFGELADPTPDWKIGTDTFYANDDGQNRYCIRNIADPNNYNQPQFEQGNISGKTVFYTDYQEYVSASPSSVYSGSTVISHAAYVMAQSVPKIDLSKIWLKSMSYYSPRIRFIADFSDCRRAVESAARDYLFDHYRKSPNTAAAYLEAIVKAFDAARIPTSHQTALSQKSADSASTMNSFISSEQYLLGNGRYWTTDDPSGSTVYSPGGYNRNTVMPGGPLVLPGFRRSNWQYEEAYYQCAGFAKKLQSDYFGTGIALRNSDESIYQPKAGDHLRVHYDIPHGPAGGVSHSIFITSVSGNTIKYADCNSDGCCKILWNQTGTVTKTNGVYTFRLGNNSTNYRFEWVERPIRIGDVNADGVLNSSDISEMSRIINGTASTYQVDTYYRNLAADANGDGVVNSSDTAIVRNLVNNAGNARSTYGFVK